MREQTRQHVLEIVKEPKTCEELSEILGVHYQTAYKYLRELQRTADVVTLPIPRASGQLVYVRDSAIMKDGRLRIAVGERLVDLPELARILSAGPGIQHRASGIIAQVYMKALVRQTDKAHLEGIKTPIEMKADMRALAGSLRRTLKAVEQLMDVEALWDDSRAPLELFGDCDPAVMEQLARAYLEDSNREKTGR